MGISDKMFRKAGYENDPLPVLNDSECRYENDSGQAVEINEKGCVTFIAEPDKTYKIEKGVLLACAQLIKEMEE